MGGISKLLTAFSRDAAPDEVVTVIDRDWGAGGGWATLGFQPLKRLPPVTFFIGPDGLRCHPGTGPNPHRRRLPPHVVEALEAQRASEPEDGGIDGGPADDTDREAELERFLAEQGYFAVRDAGAERHLLVLASPASSE